LLQVLSGGLLMLLLMVLLGLVKGCQWREVGFYVEAWHLHFESRQG
jgi:hypothetical protein